MNVENMTKWLLTGGLKDAWHMAIDGDNCPGTFSVSEVKAHAESMPGIAVSVMHPSNGEWLQFTLTNEAESRTGATLENYAIVFALLLPIVGFIMGIAMLFNSKTVGKAPVPIVLSIMSSVLWVWIWVSAFPSH